MNVFTRKRKINPLRIAYSKKINMITIYNTSLSTTSERHFSDGLGGLYPCHRKQTKNRPKRSEIDIELKSC